MTPRRPLRPLLAVASATLLALALTACGGDDSDSSDDSSPRTSVSDSPTDATDSADPDAQVYSSEELESALLTTDDLPEGFVDNTEEDEDDDTFDGTCLGDISDLSDQDGFKADNEAKAQYDLNTDDGQSSVSTTLDSYESADDLNAALDQFQALAADCTSAETTTEDGITFSLELQSNEEALVDGVDREVNLAMRGTATTADGSQSFDVLGGFAVVAVGNNLVAVSTTDVGAPATDESGVVSSTDTLAGDQLAKLQGLG